MSSSASHTTTNHEEIRQWVEERQGVPAQVRGTGSGHEAGLLRIDFPGSENQDLEEISWDDFFEKFDKEKLAFLYQDEKKSGASSYFNKLVER